MYVVVAVEKLVVRWKLYAGLASLHAHSVLVYVVTGSRRLYERVYQMVIGFRWVWVLDSERASRL